MNDPRLARSSDPQPADVNPEDAHADVAFQTDLGRIAMSPSLARLTAVTQVLAQAESTQIVHNRLTHSMKVASAAGAMATTLNGRSEFADVLDRLGGCDRIVAEAAGWAHDIGHPPFGHRGEQALDQLARERFGIAEGFEGNAQTFRTLVTLDVSDTAPKGLDLTAALRASVLKYPWARRIVHPAAFSDELPPGARPAAAGTGPTKMSAYVLDLAELESVRSAYPAIGRWKQTVEASVMDIADDITYALHDLDDFYRAGVLTQPNVAREFDGWLSESVRLAAEPVGRRPGSSLEALRRHLHEADRWIADDDAFQLAVRRVRSHLVGDVLGRPFDGSLAAQRALSSFVSSWTAHLQESLTVLSDPPARSGHVSLTPQAWHEVAVLKFVHQRFVLRRAELGLHRFGQTFVLTTIVDTLDAWLSDSDEAPRVPARLLDLVDLAHDDYRRVADDRPELLEDRGDIDRMARGRGILDYVASLTDTQAHAMANTITGQPGLDWGSV